MQPSGTTPPIVSPASDIVFACPHCAASLVVDAAAAGVSLPCQGCGQATTVPNPALTNAAGDALRISELQHQLKENESQRVEITGYMNQLSIQLHRWQLRLHTLNERQQKLQTALALICGTPAG
jgi:transcription elongation factor Elf1